MPKKIRITKTELKIFSELTDQEKDIYEAGFQRGIGMAVSIVVSILTLCLVLIRLFWKAD